jgi:hypothetical protein
MHIKIAPPAPHLAPGTSFKGVFALPGTTEKVTAELVVRTVGPLARALSIAFTDKATGQPMTHFDEELSHELHVLATDSDFSSFMHEHADRLGPDGRFRVALHFPKPLSLHATLPLAGRYALWIQFNGGGQVRTVPVVITVQAGPY